MFMLAESMVPRGLYIIRRSHLKPGGPIVQTIECSHVGDTHAFVHEPGEPDMQSSFGIPHSEPVRRLTSAFADDFGCPGCAAPAREIAPEKKGQLFNPTWTHTCSADCGWIGYREEPSALVG
jgi:hypothetical protein